MGELYAPCAAEWALACLLCGDSEPLPLSPPAADPGAAGGACPSAAPDAECGGAGAGAGVGGIDDAGFYAL
jgi:hypothetical protein